MAKISAIKHLRLPYHMDITKALKHNCFTKAIIVLSIDEFNLILPNALKQVQGAIGGVLPTSQHKLLFYAKTYPRHDLAAIVFVLPPDACKTGATHS